MIRRRSLLALPPLLAAPRPGLAQAGGVPAGGAPPEAQGAYPDHPVAMLVGFAPGGGTDITARLVAPLLSEAFGQAVAVDNRPGGTGTIAATMLSRARPDGYTMMMGTVGSNTVLPMLLNPPPFDPLRDITNVVLAAWVPQVVTVPASSPARSFGEFVALLKARPGQLNYGSSGVASSQHMATVALLRATGTSMVHVPYRGSGQAVSDLIAGAIDLNIDTLPTVLPYIRQGVLRGLAVTTPRRVDWLPDLPTVAESGVPGYEAAVRYMVMGPAGLPQPIVARWVTAVNRALEAPGVRERMFTAGLGVGGGSAAEADAIVRSEAERYGRIVREANIRIE
ncbi:tripartite tricarboxylate transporter substrate binding protein [Roseomonas sp. NAR14]|uniref:Tripartite tricarboxylate transporter substrate binding protein n=1 Tax=Roseomonas acroporae TaxID=2937791 RepID=A0A9X1Y804_9PROT|nr:tripartite tricarboxylate transporter substrate binding protein [Roseomonas acroporae]MCK8784883.1 tripartite tricarboxylate transporter substrate binding protein [Roseomonas acroporae]